MASASPPSTPHRNRSTSSSRRRRSHPHLPSFSITPLAPQYPLPPTADDPHPTSTSSSPSLFVNSPHDLPDTSSRPQTPKSYLYTSFSREGPSSVLSSRPSSRSQSRSGSRSVSRTRRNIKSALALTDLDAANTRFSKLGGSKSTTNLSKLDTDSHGNQSSSASTHRRSRSALKALEIDNESWLIQTAATLASSTAESKGQLWLSTRSAATSFVGSPQTEKEGFAFEGYKKKPYGEDEPRSPVLSHIGTRRSSLAPSTSGSGILKYGYNYGGRSAPNSRFASRAASKKGSRVNLLTPLGLRTPGEGDPLDEAGRDYFETVSVDFADDEGFDEEEGDENGDLDAEESELRRLVYARVGGWVDWAVGWMDWRDGLEGVLGEEDEEDSGNGEKQEGRTKTGEEQQETGAEKGRERRKRREELRYAETVAMGSTRGDVVPTVPPPARQGERGAGVVGDTRWFLGLARKILVQ